MRFLTIPLSDRNQGQDKEVCGESGHCPAKDEGERGEPRETVQTSGDDSRRGKEKQGYHIAADLNGWRICIYIYVIYMCIYIYIYPLAFGLPAIVLD